MRIAIIFPRLTGPYGGEKIFIKVSNELVALGHEVTIYVYEYQQVCAQYLDPKIRLVRSRSLRFGNHNLDTLIAYFAMPWLGLKIQGDYDLILGMTWQAALALWVIKKWRRRYRQVPCIYHCFEPPRFIYDLFTVTGNSFWARLVAFFIKPIDRFAVQSTDQIIAISDEIKKQVRRIYDREALIIYPGVEIERFQKYTRREARQALGIPQHQEVFLSISKLHKRKRLDQALKIFQKRRKSALSVFYIAGAGPEQERLKSSVAKMGLNKAVRFVGVVLGDQTVQYMAACDYFIFTAINEPFGIAPLEAQVAGAQVIPRKRPYPILSWRTSVQKMEKFFNDLILS